MLYDTTAGHEITVSQVPNGRPKWETGMPKNIWMAKWKGKLQAKIFLDCQNKSDGTAIFFLISYPVLY